MGEPTVVKADGLAPFPRGNGYIEAERPKRTPDKHGAV